MLLPEDVRAASPTQPVPWGAHRNAASLTVRSLGTMYEEPGQLSAS